MQAVDNRGTGATITDLASFMKAGGQRTIGALVFWSLSGVNVARAEFRETFEALGMGAAVPRDPRPETCLTTAVRVAMVGKRECFARRHGKGWALLIETIEGDKLRENHVATVTVDADLISVERALEKHPHRAAPELVWKFMGTPAQIARAGMLAAEVELQHAKARKYLDTSDLSTVLTNCMHGTTKNTLLAAVSLRETTGGLYFVHATKVDQTRLMKETIEKLAPKCSITVMTITGDADNLAAAAVAARNGFVTQLAELREEVAAFRESTPLGERTDRNVAVRARHYTTLAARVELFRDVLGGIADELAEDIDRAKGEVEDLLNA